MTTLEITTDIYQQFGARILTFEIINTPGGYPLKEINQGVEVIRAVTGEWPSQEAIDDLFGESGNINSFIPLYLVVRAQGA